MSETSGSAVHDERPSSERLTDQISYHARLLGVEDYVIDEYLLDALNGLANLFTRVGRDTTHE